MSRVTVSLGISRSAAVAPLLAGEVQAEGIDLIPTVASPGDLFWRQLHHREFDVSELSLSSLIMLVAGGDTTWRAIPVFPSRGFFHTQILVRRSAGIGQPQELRGRRVGVPEYQQTAALWTRGILQHEFGVPPGDLEWVVGRPRDRSHGRATGFRPPDGVRVQQVPEGESLASLAASGQLDALVAYRTRRGGLGLGQEPDDLGQAGRAPGPSIVGAEVANLGPEGVLTRLFADPAAEGVRYFSQTGIVPIAHTVAVRCELAQRHPWIPRNLYDAFSRSRDLAYSRLRVQLEPYAALGAVDLSQIEHAHHAAPFGLAGNAGPLEAATAYASEQGLTAATLPPASLFFPAVAQS